MPNEFQDSFGKDIRGIVVYDPKEDNFTFDVWKQAHNALRDIGPRLEYFLAEGLYQRVEERAKRDGLDLRQRLDDYFEAHPEVAVVVFLDGRFHSHYTDGLAYNGEQLAKETDSIPLGYYRPIETGEIEVTDVLRLGESSTFP